MNLEAPDPMDRKMGERPSSDACSNLFSVLYLSSLQNLRRDLLALAGWYMY